MNLKSRFESRVVEKRIHDFDSELFSANHADYMLKNKILLQEFSLKNYSACLTLCRMRGGPLPLRGRGIAWENYELL